MSVQLVARRGDPARGDVEDVARDTEPLQLEDVYRSHARFVWRIAQQLSARDGSSDIEDIVHDVFLIVHRRLPDFDTHRSIRSWLYGITRHVALRRKRSAVRAQRRLQAVEAPPAAPQPDEQLERARAAQVVAGFLDSLDDTQRLVFVLMERDGMSAPEVAETLGVKVNTVYSRLRLARRRFDAFARKWSEREVVGG